MLVAAQRPDVVLLDVHARRRDRSDFRDRGAKPTDKSPDADRLGGSRPACCSATTRGSGIRRQGYRITRTCRGHSDSRWRLQIHLADHAGQGRKKSLRQDRLH
jgi:hypothetical protein